MTSQSLKNWPLVTEGVPIAAGLPMTELKMSTASAAAVVAWAPMAPESLVALLAAVADSLSSVVRVSGAVTALLRIP